MLIISLKTDGRISLLKLPCVDDTLARDEEGESIMAESLAADAGAIIINVPHHYDLDALLVQLNEIAKRPEHQP